MEIVIIKYGPNPIDGIIRNYFEEAHRVDVMSIGDDEILERALPEYIEQLTGEMFAYRPELGGFEVKFSLLQTTLSLDEGKDIYDFFMENPDYLFLCAVFTDEKKFAGKVNMGTILIDKNKAKKGNDEYIITIHCKCLEDEFIDFLKSRSTPQIPGNITFDNVIGYRLFYNNGYFLPGYVHLVNEVQMSNKCGFEVYFRGAIYTLQILSRYPQLNTWRVLFDLMKGLGFTFKLKFKYWSSHYFYFDLIFFWRSRGLDNEFSGFNVLNDGYEEGLVDYEETNEYILVDYIFSTHATTGNTYHNALLLHANDNEILLPAKPVVAGREYFTMIFETNASGQWRWKYEPPGGKLIPKEKITVIELEGALQPIIWQLPGTWAQTSISRLLYKNPAGWDLNDFGEIIFHTAYRELAYLLRGLRSMLRLRIHYADATNLEIYNKVIHEGRNYVINRIRNLDFIKKKCEIELVEV